MKSSDDLKKQIQENKLNGWADLTDAQQAFGMAYVETYQIKSSAESTGVPLAKASKWLRDPLMLEFINELQSHLNNRSVISKDFVNLQWLSLMPKLLGEEEVAMIDKDGDVFMAKKFHASESVSLLKELSKSTNFYQVDDDGNDVKPKQVVEFIIKSAAEVDAEEEDDNA